MDSPLTYFLSEIGCDRVLVFKVDRGLVGRSNFSEVHLCVLERAHSLQRDFCDLELVALDGQYTHVPGISIVFS